MDLGLEIFDRESTLSRSASVETGEAAERICELALMPVPASVRLSRQFAAGLLTEWDVPSEPLDDAVLIVSELVTNAIRHGRPPIKLRLLKGHGALAIEVDDGDESIPRERSSTHDSLSGRGLPIVAALSSWTADATGTGKTVRSVLVVPA